MTEEQKEILISKMLDAPSALSDEELDSILHDNELRDIYDVSVAVSNACVRQPKLDMEAEWDNFHRRIRRKPSMMRWIMRVAAIFLGVIVASGIVVRIVDHVFSNQQSRAIVKVEKPLTPSNVPAEQFDHRTDSNKEKTAEGPVILKKHSADDHNRLAKAESKRTADEAMQIESDTDVDEYLRIQQALIDNDLAKQVAVSCLEEYEIFAAVLDAVGVYDPTWDDAIRKVTME